jgi:ribose transport system ATP-binding protein
MTALVGFDDVSHSYGNTQALKSCSFDIRPGEVHGLVGENGSGKSTVVKILSGVVRVRRGKVSWDGKPVNLASPRDALRLGIVTVFQETLVVEEMSGLHNVFVGQDGLFKPHGSTRARKKQASALIRELGQDPALLVRPMYSLSLGQRQILTIARALTREWKLLILDEATSALDLATRDRLFGVLTELVGGGSAILFVSHRMDELRQLIDRSTVLRSGETVTTLEKGEASAAEYLRLMSGREAPPVHLSDVHRGTTAREAQGEVLLDCKSLRVALEGRRFDLSVLKGQILGIAGLEGHGGDRFVSCLAGVRRPAGGEILVRAKDSMVPLRGYRDAFRHKIAYVPGSRQREGLFAPLSVVDNLTMPVMNRLSRLGLFRWSSLLKPTMNYVQDLGIEARDVNAPVVLLSGGNQQKVLVARWLATNPMVLVMNDPLRGVDQATKNDLYGLLRSLVANGTAIVLLSTEIEELLTVCDRVAVFHEQSLGEVIERNRLSYDAILRAMFGTAVETEAG